MTNYPFEMQLVVDPTNPRNVVAGGSVSIYDSADTGKTTLLPLTDPNGVPITNPITSNGNGFTEPFVTTSPQVLWVSGEYVDYFNSYVGMRNEALAAKTASESAAANAGAAAVADLNARIASGVFKGEKGADGSNVLPTDTAVKDAIANPASLTRGELNATYGPRTPGKKPVGQDELIVNVKDHGVKGDAVKKTNGGAITSGSATFTGAGFTAADVGKAFYVVGAGAAGATLSTTIAAYVSATQVTLAATAGTTVADAAHMYGTDDTAAIQPLLDSVSNTTSHAFFFPKGAYITAGLHLKSNTRLVGAGRGGWAYEFYDRSTRLIARPGMTTTGLINDYNGTIGGNVYLSDMMLDGAKQYHANPRTGIYMADSTISADSLWNLERVMVKDFSGDGAYFGVWRRANRVNECHFVGNTGHGSIYAGSDNSAMQSMWAMNGGNGLEISASSNHFYGADIFNNTGHGVKMVPLARMNHFVSCMFDTNKKSGVYTEAKNTSLVQCRFTSNSQEADGVYPDIDIVGGPSGVAIINPTFYTQPGTITILPHSGIRAVSNNAVNLVYLIGFSHDSGVTTWRSGSYVESSMGALHKGFTLADGSILTMGTTNGVKLGGASTEKIGFYGATPIVRPTKPANATDLATAITAINDLMAKLSAGSGGVGLIS